MWIEIKYKHSFIPCDIYIIKYDAQMVTKLQWVNRVKHLGHTSDCCANFDADIRSRKGNFIACVNNTLSEFAFVDPQTKLKMCNTYGLSMYGSCHSYWVHMYYTFWPITTAMRLTNCTPHGILLWDACWMFHTGATPDSRHILPGLVI